VGVNVSEGGLFHPRAAFVTHSDFWSTSALEHLVAASLPPGVRAFRLCEAGSMAGCRFEVAQSVVVGAVVLILTVIFRLRLRSHADGCRRW
jgi:hypothetical protein